MVLKSYQCISSRKKIKYGGNDVNGPPLQPVGVYRISELNVFGGKHNNNTVLF